MRLHESHEEGGFGVSHNMITRHAASYTTNARFVAFLGTFARAPPRTRPAAPLRARVKRGARVLITP
jgi:hypothetical protein